jgi:hypothetical protein
MITLLDQSETGLGRFGIGPPTSSERRGTAAVLQQLYSVISVTNN